MGLGQQAEPLFAHQRRGSTPDALLDELIQIGFNLDEESDDIGPTTTAALALAERLTGIRVTEELLADAVFVCGTARLPA